MKARVSEQGVLIPKEFFTGIEEVEIHQHDDTIIIVAILPADPILQLGMHPIEDRVRDASTNHDHYICDL
jgi:virulence-associated protein VagC